MGKKYILYNYDYYVILPMVGVELSIETDMVYNDSLYLSTCGEYIVAYSEGKCFLLKDELSECKNEHYGDFLKQCLVYIRNKKIDKLVNG
jgi:hypothetical protein